MTSLGSLEVVFAVGRFVSDLNVIMEATSLRRLFLLAVARQVEARFGAMECQML